MTDNMYHISSVVRWGFSFQNNPKNLDPSYNKMDLDFRDCVRREKIILYINFTGLI